MHVIPRDPERPGSLLLSTIVPEGRHSLLEQKTELVTNEKGSFLTSWYGIVIGS